MPVIRGPEYSDKISSQLKVSAMTSFQIRSYPGIQWIQLHCIWGDCGVCSDAVQPLMINNIKFHGQRSLRRGEGCSPWGHKESDMIHSLLDFPGSSGGKESACSVGDPGSIPELGRSP